MWLVIGMALFRDRSIQEVVEHLELAIARPGPRGGVAPSAIPPARERLGVEAVKYLFELTAQKWAAAEAEKDRWNGLSVWGLDGSCLRIADTVENEGAFGRPGSWRSTSGYPQVRLVALMALRSHILADMNVGGYHESEMTLVKPLWAKVPDESLTIVDRGFISWGPLYALQTCGENKHWLTRTKSNLNLKHVKKLGAGDSLVEISPSSKVRKENPQMPATFVARLVSYKVKGYRAQNLLTSMVDVEKYPAREMAELYHERLELELGYDEVKTHMLEREEALRSKKPNGVLQEVAGIGLAYNLVRVEMARVAAEMELAPTRLSFRHALVLIRNFCLAAWATSPGAVPQSS